MSLKENKNVLVLRKCDDAFIRFSCPQCGKCFKVSHQNAGKKGRCTCGMHVQIPDSKLEIPSTVTVSFMGTALPFFGRVLLAILSEVLIIPAPWVRASLYRWIVEHLSLSDGTCMTFSGKGSDIWPVFMLSGFVGWLGLLPLEGMNMLSSLLQLILWLTIVRWIVRNISISNCRDFSFAGKDTQLLGWRLLFALSVITLVGWAWVIKGLARWYCKNVVGHGHSVVYVGTGWGILWRTVITAIGCCLLIPTPWVTHWLFSWHVNNIRITRNFYHLERLSPHPYPLSKPSAVPGDVMQTTNKNKIAGGGKTIVLSTSLFIFFAMLQMAGPTGIVIGFIGSVLAFGLFLFGLYRYVSGRMSKR